MLQNLRPLLLLLLNYDKRESCKIKYISMIKTLIDWKLIDCWFFREEFELLTKAFAQTERLVHDPLSHRSTKTSNVFDFLHIWPFAHSISLLCFHIASIIYTCVQASLLKRLFWTHKFLIGLLLWDQKLTGSYTWKPVSLDGSLKHRIFWRLRSSFQYLFTLNWFLYLL